MSAPGHLTAQTGADQEAALSDQVNRMIALAEEAQSEETWAFDALSRFVTGCAGQGLDPLAAVEGAGVSRSARERLLGVLEEIVRAGHGEGALRPDVGAGDVVGIVGLVVRGLPTVPAGVGEELRERAARLVLAGMRTHPTPAPPGVALTGEELVRRITG
ncbi:hypothetical protein HCN51_12435 [Nonomuraea sp. FMUSA5-5]|uniref:Uncharacterized protein n=1 Tax=Nonomuraea composti TaxID=2720023 RepID=A0ABX1B4Z3_9ACTN|nr:hypothetical protein [Nonomuraea sp. FMUSA5-5]NJP90246.1 hypothetical protein [Nonomuraea sp. FMUSA5-5]